MLESLPAVTKKNTRDLYPTASAEAIELIERLLHFNPAKRPTSEEVFFFKKNIMFCNFIISSKF